LQRVVFGQHDAVHLVAQAIKRSRAGLGLPDPRRLFSVRRSDGSAQTELAKRLAIQLGNEFSRIDMSGTPEKHAVARLIGAAGARLRAGWPARGHGAHASVRVVLLDEIEGAPDIYNILLQVMDHAALTGNTGRRRTSGVVLILTSNAGSREMSAQSIGFAEGGSGDATSGCAGSRQASPRRRSRGLQPGIPQPPDAIVTFRTSPAVMEQIVDKFVLQLEQQLAERHVAIP
jgi:ATP-dependent Clp protease ATP-binding subunit ClpA